MAIRQLSPLALLPLLTSAPLQAQDFQFQIDGAQSFSTVDNEIVVQLPSTVIGDYDTTTNPGGTRTVPGLFGGSGNNTIPMDLSLTIDSLFSRPAAGSFLMSVDEPGLSVSLEDLQLDLLSGGTADTDLNLGMLFDTFRTFAPDSLYLGGIPIDAPLGTSTLSELQVAQIPGPALGALVPTANPGEFTLVLSVAAELSFVIDFQGQVTPVGPTPVLLPLVGTLLLNGDQATVALQIDLNDQQQVLDPAPGFAIVDQALPLPTVLPPGATANLLLNATISQLDTDLLLDVDLVADGSVACGFESFCDSASNSTGQMAQLTVSGSPDVTAAQLNFDVVQLPANRPGIFFMSQSTANVPGFGGSQGTLCLGAPQLRFPQVQFSDAMGTVSFAPDFGNLPGGVSFLPDSTWYLQYWYRDSNPGATSNTTDGVRMHFCP